jgi:predicted SAM-dependent methyltransferase
MKGLNLGCGTRFHPDWTNIDVSSVSPYVEIHDLRKGVPFPDATFDVVYHSHLLEHLPKEKALPFSQECYRVLKRGGIIRVVVPDLEQIARMYLLALDKAIAKEDEWQYHYAWMMLELYDQTVRELPGGDMLEYLKQQPIPNETFVYDRLGGEARRLVQALVAARCKPEQDEQRSDIWDSINRVRCLPRLARARLVRWVLGEYDYKALQIGRFRLGGEVHHWMYDRYSLARLLEHAGFQNPTQRTAFESAIDNWVHFNLDTEPDGIVYKPDSLYLEAFKPAA